MTPKGRETLLNSESFSVPNLDGCEAIEYSPNSSSRKRSASSDIESDAPPKKKLCASTRVGKGTHGLKVVNTLLEDEENWKQISSKDDYQYLGVLHKEPMQIMYYSPDCTKLNQNCSTDPHFLWHDIQLCKDKVNKD